MQAKTKILLFISLTILLGSLLKIVLPANTSKKALLEKYWSSKITKNDKYNLIIAGDSRIYRGLSSNIFFDTNKVSTYNLGFPSAGYSMQYLDYLDTKIKNKNSYVILGVTPHSFLPSSFSNDKYNGLLKKGKINNQMNIIFYPLFNFFEAYSLVNFFTTKNSYSIQIPRYNGWMESDLLVRDSTQALKDYINNFSQEKITPNNLDPVLNKTSFWVNKGITVFGFRPPTTYQMVGLEDSLSGFDFNTFVPKFTSAGGVWLDIKQADFESYDGSHLTPESAIKLSRQVSSKVKDYVK